MRKKISYLLFPFLLVMISGSGPVGFPQWEISNGIIHAYIYLPDPMDGYYRGTRFDWAGVMPVLEYKGHSYCGQWFERYEPTIHDAIMGPVESFSPLGYEQAKPGGSFVQIGVGLLTRKDTSAYSPFRYYPILNPGDWKIVKKKAKIEFRHTLNDSAFSYVYKKSLELVKGKEQLVLRHSFKNTGSQTIETDVYDHNLFVMDHQPTGPGFTVQFPFALSSEGQSRGIGEIAVLKGDQLAFQRALAKKEQVFTVLKGYGDQARDYDIKIENHHTGAALRITADRPLSRLVFWACATTLSPEPYIRLKVNPGESFDWTIRYEFYTCAITNP